MVPSLQHLVFTTFLAEEVYCWYHLNFTEYQKYAEDSQIFNPNSAGEQLDTNANLTEEQWNSNSTTKKTSGIHDLYIDFRRIGFQIFVQKLIEGLRILRYFLEIDPPVVKLTDLYTHVNETSNNYNNTSNLTSGTTNEYFDYLNDENYIETTTESPLKNNLTENPLDKVTENIKEMKENTEKVEESKVQTESQPPHNDSVKSNEINRQSEEEVEKKPEEGFFTSVANQVASIFHSFTNWFKNIFYKLYKHS
ncbi:uncharacterized protein LOC124364453 [Homalodisca vitripennis]|uniref:uncharacterized protein LOC124364453 n=1 Tax=Homalodisca vitripennis TaxID=197043 RepID=UPI001EEBC9E6|nr:uncharacterized protein LOC124364453 [Homalodisca vitripennis]